MAAKIQRFCWIPVVVLLIFLLSFWLLYRPEAFPEPILLSIEEFDVTLSDGVGAGIGTAVSPVFVYEYETAGKLCRDEAQVQIQASAAENNISLTLFLTEKRFKDGEPAGTDTRWSLQFSGEALSLTAGENTTVMNYSDSLHGTETSLYPLNNLWPTKASLILPEGETFCLDKDGQTVSLHANCSPIEDRFVETAAFFLCSFDIYYGDQKMYTAADISFTIPYVTTVSTS